MSNITESDASIDETSLTDQQEVTLSLLNIISGTLSIFGSSLIIYLVHTNPRKTPYRRILLGLSACDIAASLTYALQPFMSPRDTSPRVWSSGNDATCSVQGFLTQFSFSAIWYNACLSIYYLCTVRYGMKNKEFAVRYERWIHSLAISYNLLTAIIGVSIGLFSEFQLGQGCWIAEYPENCLENDNCIGHLIGWVFGGIPFLMCFTTVCVSNALIYKYVKNTVNSDFSPMSADKRHRINQLANQGFFYVGTFFVAYIWTFIVKIVESLEYGREEESDIYGLLFLNAMFLPTQGMFNLLVYTRPGYLRVRDEFPQETRLWAVRRSWFGSLSPHRTDADLASSDPNSGSRSKSRQMNAAERAAALAEAAEANERRLKASQGFTNAVAKAEHALQAATASDDSKSKGNNNHHNNSGNNIKHSNDNSNMKNSGSSNIRHNSGSSISNISGINRSTGSIKSCLKRGDAAPRRIIKKSARSIPRGDNGPKSPVVAHLSSDDLFRDELSLKMKPEEKKRQGDS